MSLRQPLRLLPRIVRSQPGRSVSRLAGGGPARAPTAGFPVRKLTLGLAVGGLGLTALGLSGGGLWQMVECEAPVPLNVRLDPATSLPFPELLTPTSLGSTTLHLVGLGVRTVSFLRVKVYSAGFYVPEGTGKGGVVLGGEEAMGKFLESGQACVMRIVPARSSDFSHLRDAFVRSVQGRLKVLSKAGLISDDEAERAQHSLTMLKSFFPNRSAPKGSEVLLVKLPSNKGLAVEFEGKVLGVLDDKVVAKEIFTSYFLDGGKASSLPLKQSIVEGFQQASL